MSDSSPLKNARIKIELDTDDAQARLDLLEERMEEINRDIEDGAETMEQQNGQAGGGGGGGKRPPRGHSGMEQPSRDTTKPGKFGIRNIPGLMSAQGLAAAAPFGIGGPLSTGIGWELQYGAMAKGLTEGGLSALGISSQVAKSADPFGNPFEFKGESKLQEAMRKAGKPYNEQSTFHKKLVEADLRLKSFQPALEMTIEMAKAVLVTGGHLSANSVKNFATTAYEWEFVQARKDKDIRDKSIEMISREAPGAIAELFQQVVRGNFVP
jgi:hypothetical protein